MGAKTSKTSPEKNDGIPTFSLTADEHPPFNGISPERRQCTKPATFNINGDATPPPATYRIKKTRKQSNLDPLFVVGEDLPAVVKKEMMVNSSLNVRDNLSESRMSLRSNATISDTSWYTDNSSIQMIEYQDYQYPFENIVFEGGGTKGYAYVGAVKVLEEVGVWPNIKRFAGTSAGSMWATLLAVGFNSGEVERFLRNNLRQKFLDARFGFCSILPNLRRHFGWHPGRRIFEWFGDCLEQATDNSDITFKQLYDLKGTELCIVVTNVNLMDVEYCHVKTTPNLPVRTAVRMSMSIPGLFGAVKYKRYGRTDVFVDGGVLCNYPIHCFDGWWLSLDHKDAFLRRLTPLTEIYRLWDKAERFGEINPKTIGLLLYSSDEQELMMKHMQKRTQQDPPNRPKTKLSRKRKEKREMKMTAAREHAIVTTAFEKFMKVLADNQLDNQGTVRREELEKAFANDNDEFTEDHARELFGNSYKVNDVFEFLDLDGNGEINFNELMSFAEQKGIGLQTHFVGYQRREINNVTQFLKAVQDTLLVNVKRVYVNEDDIDRTIGIDTLYIGTTDWEMEEEDRTFLIEQGERAARSYLRHYVRKNDPPLREGLRVDSGAPTRKFLSETRLRPSLLDPIEVPTFQPNSSVLS